MKNKFKLVFKLCSRKMILYIIGASLVLFICYVFFSLMRRPVDTLYEYERYIVFDETYEVRSPKIGNEELLWRVEQSMSQVGQIILNEDQFPNHSNDMSVIVVLAGRRPARLQWLLASLATVSNIDEALLVVSSSFIDDAVEELIKKVNYCRVLQLYYPYSVQLFPHRFPGTDFNRSHATAIATEQKQHWWWTANFLFQHYHWVDNKLGTAIFLQEDDIVAPDLLYMLTYAKRAFMYHPEAEVISLGRPASKADNLLTVTPWQPPFEGIAFNRSFWKKLQASASHFCQYNDVSWSYSLLAAFASLQRGYVDTITSLSPRVLSTRFHASALEGAKAARELFYKSLYPTRVRVAFVASDEGRVTHPEPVPRGAGGWEDARDRLLCVDPFLMTTPNPPYNGTLQRENLKLPGT